MEKEYELLKEWTLNYIKNQDILLKAIKSIEENKDGWNLLVKTKTEVKCYLIIPKIEDFSKITSKLTDHTIIIVVLNTKENLDLLIDSWDDVNTHPKLRIVFVNPNSELEKKWVVFPRMHDKVTERANLKKGLKTLFKTVDAWKK